MVDEDAIKPPVIVDTRNELLFFRSAEAAGAYIEEVDVRNGEYQGCWDSEGRPLAIRIEPRGHAAFKLLRWSTESVVLRQLDPEPTQAIQLREVLVRYLGASPPDREALAGESLPRLVELGVVRGGFTK